jgi:hypothetical protein
LMAAMYNRVCVCARRWRLLTRIDGSLTRIDGVADSDRVQITDSDSVQMRNGTALMAGD